MYFMGVAEKTKSDKSVCMCFVNYKAQTRVSSFEEGSKWGDWEKTQDSQGGVPTLLSGALTPWEAT